MQTRLTIADTMLTRITPWLAPLLIGAAGCADTSTSDGADTAVATSADTITTAPLDAAATEDIAPDAPPETDAPEPEIGVAPLVPAPIDEPFGRPVPDAMYLPDWETDTCTIGAHAIPMFGADALDDCRICQCTWRGGRCARRASCARDVCVFADGQTAAPGESTRVAGCYVCTCDASGGTCVRDTEAPCRADGCLVPYPGEARTVAVGASLFVSECHQCTCDAQRGLICVDLCHPMCSPYVDHTDVMVEDQARMPADNGLCSCVCDYGRMACDPRGCDPNCGVEQDACSGG